MVACTIYIYFTVLLLQMSSEQNKQYADKSKFTTLDVNKYILIGSFNMKTFGPRKMNNDVIAGIYAKIIQRYDIIALQEIKDASNVSIWQLLNLINKEKSFSEHWKLSLSPRLGKKSYGEQYAVFYRSNLLSVMWSKAYPDHSNIIEREPWLVQFVTNKIFRRSKKEFTMVNVHISPKKANEEINALDEVVRYVLDSSWRKNLFHKLFRFIIPYYENKFHKNILIAGDLNAACRYMPKKSQNLLKVKNQYLWIIPDYFDTTVSENHCAYDRFIGIGELFRKAVILGSARVWYYERDLHVNQSLTRQVSDHYPIEFKVCCVSV